MSNFQKNHEVNRSENKKSVVIKFPNSDNNDISKTLAMTEQELDDSMRSCGEDPSEIVNTYLKNIELSGKAKKSSSLKEYLENLKNNMKIEKNLISSLKERREEIKFFNILVDLQIILTTFFLIVTLSATTYSSFVLFNSELISISFLMFTILQLSIVSIQKHINYVMIGKTKLTIDIYSKVYVVYSSIGALVVIGEILEERNIIGLITNNQVESAFISMFVFMSALVAIISMDLLCDFDKKSNEKYTHSKKYGNSGYNNTREM